MNQVHKETLSLVENALPNRQGLEVEIFGMEGIPEDVVQQHNQRLIQNFYQEQADRYAATGNPPPGESGKEGPVKKIKIESTDEIKKRLADHRARVAAQKANGGVANPTPPMGLPDGQSPGQNVSLTKLADYRKHFANARHRTPLSLHQMASISKASRLKAFLASLRRHNIHRVLSTTLPVIFRHDLEVTCLHHLDCHRDLGSRAMLKVMTLII